MWGNPSEEDTFQSVQAASKQLGKTAKKSQQRLSSLSQLQARTVDQLQEMVSALVAEQVSALTSSSRASLLPQKSSVLPDEDALISLEESDLMLMKETTGKRGTCRLGERQDLEELIERIRHAVLRCCSYNAARYDLMQDSQLLDSSGKAWL